MGSTGPWTDVYALALVLIELLAGRPAIDGDDFIQLGMAAVNPERRPTPRALGVTVPNRLEQVLARAVSVKPEERFATAKEFWDAILQRGSLPSFSDPLVLDAARASLPAPAEEAPVVRRRRALGIAKASLLSVGLGTHARGRAAGASGGAVRGAYSALLARLASVRISWSHAAEARTVLGSIFARAYARSSPPARPP